MTIVSASRRTDIPNYFGDWFFNRLDAGFACVRNPVNPRQVSRVSLAPEDVSGIVFWTKNPAGMLGRLGRLADFIYYFQFTLTGYGRDVEPYLPDKKETLVPAFRKLAQEAGADRVIWRYDPILVNDRYTPEYHRKAFCEIADRTLGCTKKVIISFVDWYGRNKKALADLGAAREEEPAQTGQEKTGLAGVLYDLAGELAFEAKKRGLVMETCAEEADLGALGIGHGCCVDKGLLERLGGRPIAAGKDRSQRLSCGCAQSVDIGAYHTCPTACRYCYAVGSRERVLANLRSCDKESPLLLGRLGAGDMVRDRE